MPTNRVRIKRAVRSRVTDEARAIYAAALKFQDMRRESARSVAYRSTSIGEPCSGCTKYMDLSRELGRLLGVNFWEVSPLDADSEAPPKWMNPLQHGYWVKAWALRCELAGRAMTASSSACKSTKSRRLCFHGFADVGQPSADLPPLPRGCGLSAVFRIALRWRQ